MASCHAHINTLVCLHDILSDVQYGFQHGMFPGKGQCLYKRLFVHVHASDIVNVMCNEGLYTCVYYCNCIFRNLINKSVMRIQPLHAADYQMYSKASHK